ncbi:MULTISPECIES: hypothetical protein [unclassified Paraburkholderia]|uniref:hypothetical protein n=1 Tax=unclassified Paraburkholderia TaxID=2615204 RepID=UPI00161768A8|nr:MULTISPECIES: hypothetical protein [unclassified Paraburkholderia]MBB5447901.1 hypothetical protein [Paraburkholderia sp. WSM4177]MBB5488319.1 hypothetical protein [Paraburkholderia sp. WSM4180]
MSPRLSLVTPHARRGRLAAAAATFGNTLGRMPLAAEAVPIAGAFVCSLFLYGRIAGVAIEPGWRVLAGLASFFLLFVQLRLIDDLDDLERDYPTGHALLARREARRTRLVASIAASAILLVALNTGMGHARTAAAAATALAFAAPFVFKRLLPTHPLLCLPAFEGAPFAIFTYGYFFWRDMAGRELSFYVVVCVAGSMWTGYEFWKFSRKVGTTALQPYLLSARAIRVTLNALLILALGINVSLSRLASLSQTYSIYAATLPLVWLVWLNASWPGPASRPGRPRWAGTRFIVAVELGLLAGLLLK